MKPQDPFEEHLRRQPPRPMPAAWRNEILANARAAAAADRRCTAANSAAEDGTALILGWRLLFARLPLAWASLAALWIAIVGVNLLLPGPIVSFALQEPASDRMAELAALESAASDQLPAVAPSAPTSEVLPSAKPAEVPLRRPRSERRRSLDFGEVSQDFQLVNLV